MAGEGKKVRVGVVGLGYIAQNVHIPSLVSMDDVAVTAGCDSNEETLARVGRRYGIKSLYTDPREMAGSDDCDCVFVLTKPDSSHAPIAMEMLEHGKDVFCEKPMATTLREARQMIEAAQRGSRVLMVGFNRRFMPICVKAREVFQGQGRKLDVCKVTFTGTKPRPGALLANPHPVDLLRFFCGEAVSVQAVCKKDATAAEESITALVEFDSGAAGVLVWDNQSGGSLEAVELHGGGYSVWVDTGIQTTRILDGARAGLFNPQEYVEFRPAKWLGFQGVNGFLQQDRQFVECVMNRARPVPDAEDAYRSHELMNRIYQACGLPTLD